MKYRSRNDIFASILQAASEEKEGAKLTKIMYKSFVSYLQLSDFLAELTKHELLMYESKSKRYTVTQKGIKFLDLYLKMDQLIQPEDTISS
jgi:predicted transcriptional regulator